MRESTSSRSEEKSPSIGPKATEARPLQPRRAETGGLAITGEPRAIYITLFGLRNFRMRAVVYTTLMIQQQQPGDALAANHVEHEHG